MIRRLRKRIAFTLTTILTFIMLGIQLFQYSTSYYYYGEYQKSLMQDIADRILFPNTADTEDVTFDLNYQYLPIWVFQVQEGNIPALIQKNKEASYTVSEAAAKVLSLDKKEGVYKNIWYLHKDTILILIDDSETLNYYKNQALIFCVSGLAGFLLILACSLFLSKWLVKPAAQAFEQQKQFISDASHELKTPLTVVGANAQRLKNELGESKWLDYILAENKRMGKLLNELLTLAKVEGSPENDTFEPVNLSKIVTGALLPYESIAYEKGIELWMDIQNDLFVFGEEEHLKQAVIILTDNAFYHVSEHGEIKIKLHQKGKKAEISVSNTGEEIPKEEQQKIFQRFYRANKGRNRAENRYGLGLAIAAGIVKRHNGKIEVVSEAGCTIFTILLSGKKN